MNIKEQIFNSPGYTTDIRLRPNELALLTKFIESSMTDRVSDVYRGAGLSNYHTVNHHFLFSDKEARLLSQNYVEKAKYFELFGKIRKELGEFRIAPVIFNRRIVRNREEIYWRVVRPNEPGDVAEVHADTWHHGLFSDAYGSLLKPDEYTLKVWIPIVCETGLNGLAVVPDSHNRDWPVKKTEMLNRTKIELIESVETILLNTEAGQCVIFNDKLLHVGALNRGTKTRVSAEITLIFKK